MTEQQAVQQKQSGRARTAKRMMWLASAAFAIATPAAMLAQPSPAKDGLSQPRPNSEIADQVPVPPKNPAWSLVPKAPKGAPNILVILTDDIGFAASQTFGGPIPSPNLDKLASRGVRYNNFHTSAICSATRAALLTGRNPTRVGMGGVTNLATSHSGHTSMIPPSAATLAKVLKDNGYNTAMFGKSHITPHWETGPAGPFDRWPTGLGFEYFYGFLDGDTDQFAPQLYLGTVPVEPPYNDPNYILDKDLADHAISWLATRNAVQPDKPFFAYYAPGTAHAPHQAPRTWIDQFKGQFDNGWDALRVTTLKKQIATGIVPAGTKLSPRPAEVAAWASLSSDQKRLAARTMEVYAGAVAYADHEIGRVVDELERQGQLDNTMIVFIQGDNGSSAEGGTNGLFNEIAGLNEKAAEDFPVALAHIDKLGGPLTYGHFPAGWAHAMSTPFPYFKRIASHLGATRNGMVISWPERISKDLGTVRSQFHHVIDIFPTILDATGIASPTIVDGTEQMPVDGISMLYSTESAKAPPARETQFFEISGDAAIYSDGWYANTVPIVMPWQFTGVKEVPFADRKWELYNLSTDFSQSKEISVLHPDKLAALKAEFFVEAERNNALPISRIPSGESAPRINAGKTSFHYTAGMKRLPPAVAPDLRNRSFTIEADIQVPETGGEGVIVTQGGRFGGYALYFTEGRPVFVYNKLGLARTRLESSERLALGVHSIRLDFAYDGGGIGKGGLLTLTIGKAVVTQRIESTIPLMFPLSETFDVGDDTGTPVAEDYSVPFRFNGKVRDVHITLP